MDLIDTNMVEGRWSNGLLAVEVLANLLNAGLTDYAWTGATTGYGSLDDNKHGIFWQIDQFKSDLKGKTVDAGALFFIAGGVILVNIFGRETICLTKQSRSTQTRLSPT